MGMIVSGRALAETGGAKSGIGQMHQGLAAFRAAGGEITRPYYLALLAELYGKAGNPDEGVTVLVEAQAALDKSSVRCWQAELWRIKGELILQQVEENSSQADGKRAETSFQQALDAARRQGAKSWELRTVLSLSRLWQRQGRSAEARSMLAELFGWFSEGFDTTDLKDARRMLAEQLRGELHS
jgi:predicted ATPase